MTGKPDWSGTPLVSGANQLMAIPLASLAQGASFTDTVAVTRPGYIIQIELVNNTSSVTVLPVTVSMIWQDTATNTVVARQEHHILAGSVGNPTFVDGIGPAAGNQFTLKVTNNCAAADFLGYSVYMAEVTHQYEAHQWTTDDKNSFSPSGFTVRADDAIANVLIGDTGTSVTNGTTKTFVLPYYAGPVFFCFTTGSKASDLTVQIIAVADTGEPGSWPVFSGKTDSNGNLNGMAFLPRVECTVALTNGNAAPQTVTSSVVVAPSF